MNMKNFEFKTRLYFLPVRIRREEKRREGKGRKEGRKGFTHYTIFIFSSLVNSMHSLIMFANWNEDITSFPLVFSFLEGNTTKVRIIE